MPLGPGSLVGRYRLLDLLGRGGMGVVYRAQDTELDREVAVKLLAPQLAMDPAFVDRFRREARLAAGLRHPNIVVVHDWGTQDDQPYLVMELLEGRSLKQVIQERGRLPIEQAAQLVAQCAEALHYAHDRGLVHRDVKPANIMVDPRGRAVLTDFGVARAASSPSLTTTGGIIGTPEYLSPEQAMGRPVDGRADQYALGIVLYEALAGRTPFAADSTPAIIHLQVYSPPPRLADVRPDLPPALHALIERALEKDPARRFPTTGDFGQALLGALAGGPTARPAGPPQSAHATVFAEPRGRPTPAPGPATASQPASTFPWRYAALVPLVLVALFVTARFGFGLGESQPEPTATPRPTTVAAAAATATPPPSPPPASPAPVVALAPAPSPSPSPDPALALLREADALALQDLNAAAARYQQIINQQPKLAAAHRQLGIGRFWQGHTKEAVAALEQATTLNSRDALAWAYLAAAYIDDYQYQKSTQAAARADQTDPNLAESKAALSVNEAFERNTASARRWMEAALNIDPDTPLGVLAKIHVADLEADTKLAIETRRRLVGLRPAWGMTHVVLGYELMRLEQYDEALATVQRAQQVDPELHGGDALRGFLLARQERFDEAVQAFEAELKRSSTNAVAHAGLGWVAYARQDWPTALEAFRKATALDSRSVDGFEGTARVLSEGMDQQLEAEANFRRALELYPPNADAWVGLGITQYKRQQWEPAIETFRKAVELREKDLNARRWLAYTLMEANRLADARRELDAMKAIAPDDPDLPADYAELQRRGG